MHVAVGGQSLERIFLNFDDGDVEGAAAEIKNQDPQRLVARQVACRGKVALLITVGDCSRSRFIDDVKDLQTGQSPGVHRRPSAGFIEIGGYGDYGLLHRAKVFFRVRLEAAENE